MPSPPSPYLPRVCPQTRVFAFLRARRQVAIGGTVPLLVPGGEPRRELEGRGGHDGTPEDKPFCVLQVRMRAGDHEPVAGHEQAADEHESEEHPIDPRPARGLRLHGLAEGVQLGVEQRVLSRRGRLRPALPLGACEVFVRHRSRDRVERRRGRQQRAAAGKAPVLAFPALLGAGPPLLGREEHGDGGSSARGLGAHGVALSPHPYTIPTRILPPTPRAVEAARHMARQGTLPRAEGTPSPRASQGQVGRRDDGARDVSAHERGLGGAQPHEQAAQRRVEQHAILLSSPITLRRGEVELLDGLALGRLATAVVARRRRHVGVPGELLYGTDIYLGFKQVRHERAPQVMGRRVCDLGLGRAPGQRVVDGAGRDARAPDAAALVNGQEQHAGPVAPDREPGVHGDGRARLQRHHPVLVALAAFDRERGRVRRVVLNFERGQLGAAQAADVEAGEHRRVARPGRRAVPRTRLDERRQFARADVPAGRQARTLVRLDLGDAPVLLVGHHVEVAGLARDPTQDGQREVNRRRRRLGFDELRLDEGDVMGTELAPGQRRVVGDLDEPRHGAQALDSGRPARRAGQAVEVGAHGVAERRLHGHGLVERTPSLYDVCLRLQSGKLRDP